MEIDEKRTDRYMKKPAEVIAEIIEMIKQMAERERNAPSFIGTAKTPQEAHERVIKMLERWLSG